MSCDFTSELQVDQSVSHNGVCLTVVALEGDNYTVTAIKETLEKTNVGTWKLGDAVNLERGYEIGCPPRTDTSYKGMWTKRPLVPVSKTKMAVGSFRLPTDASLKKCDHRKRVHHHQRHELDCREFEKKRVQCGHHSLHLRTHELSPFSNRYRGQFGI